MFKFFKKKYNPKKNKLGLTFKVKQSDIEVGKYTYGYENLNIMEYGNGTNLKIGKFTSIAPGVKVFLGYGGHNLDNISTYPFHALYLETFKGTRSNKSTDRNKGDVIIGNDVWLGLDTLILNGVTIGDGAVIGANSVVTRNIEPYEFVAGNPAKHIRFRFDKEVINLLMKLKWWDLAEVEIKSILLFLQNKPDAKILEELIKKFSK